MKTAAKLKACSKTKKNCVSTANSSGYHAMVPIHFACEAAEAMNHLKNILHTMKNAEIAEQRKDYLHAVFTSNMLKFKDDVEFFIAAGDQQIHFRSSSRIGYYDFGVNRKRMDEIRERFKK
jgi:uncharacterized protein (DUF1499 family)